MKKRIEYLDGLRGTSIALVLVAHGGYSFGANKFLNLYELGYKGVLLFFCISGFIITNILLDEVKKKGKISLTSFYLRRSLRIFPVFYTYIITIAVLQFFGFIDLSFKDFLAASLHVWNYRHMLFSYTEESLDIWYLSHFWTLAVEGQFYLIWPIILNSFDHKKLFNYLPFLLCSFPFIRLLDYFLLPSYRGYTYTCLHTIADSILWGSYLCLLIRFNKSNIELVFKSYDKLFLLILIAAFIFLLFGSSFLVFVFKGYYLALFKTSIESICLSYFLMYLLINKPFWAEFLNSKYVVFIGYLSFSLYVWQQLFLSHHLSKLNLLFPYNYCLCILTATISYYLIEKPINQRKQISNFK